MQQKMRRLISYLIFGLTISLVISCEKDIDYDRFVKGCINNLSTDTVSIKWYWNYCGNFRSDSLYLEPSEYKEINDNDGTIFDISFDSVMLSNSKQKIVYIPHPRHDTLEHCVPIEFLVKLDKNKSTDVLSYYSCTITDSTFQFMADECAKLGQDIWRKK